jgi:hypothetical protein
MKLAKIFSLIALAAGSFLPALPAQAANGTVTVVHGIPGLPAPVDVFANNNKLFSFSFGEQQGPLSLPEGNYNLEVRLQGNPVLKATAAVKAGRDYTAIAHLLEGGKINLGLFENDVTAIGANNSRVQIRHLADAPAVDVRLYQLVTEVATIPNLKNPNTITTEIASGKYFASIFPAGSTTPVFGPVALNLETGYSYIINAVGSLAGNSFGLILEATDLTGLRSSLTAMVGGKGCGGTIGVSPKVLTYDKAFKVTLDGAHPGSGALVLVGQSSTNLVGLNLPWALDGIGAPGCMLYVAPLVYLPIALDSRGNGEAEFTIPSTLAGFMKSVYFQYAFPAPGVNALGFQFTGYASVKGGM